MARKRHAGGLHARTGFSLYRMRRRGPGTDHTACRFTFLKHCPHKKLAPAQRPVPSQHGVSLTLLIEERVQRLAGFCLRSECAVEYWTCIGIIEPGDHPSRADMIALDHQ